MEAVPVLRIAPAGLDDLRPLPVEGPRNWWGGALDVEALALGSVGAAAASLNRLLGRTAVQRILSPRVAASFDSPGVLRIDGAPIRAFSGLSRFFPTADGWVRTHGNYPHHARLLLQALSVDRAEAVPAALAELTSLEAEQRIQSIGAVGAAVRTRGEWGSSALATRTPTAPTAQWIDIALDDRAAAGSPGSPWIPDNTASRPLRGLRVLDLTRTIAGPISSRLMTALGAEVLRVDPPANPELEAQHIDGDPGKYTTAADLGCPETQARFHELLASAHVLLLGYRAGSLDRFGLGLDALRERYPGLSVVRFNAWGWGTAWQDRRGFDSVVQAACGIADAYRGAGGSPGALRVQALDHATGYGIFAATMSLLTARAQSGATGHARLALASTADLLFELSVAGRDPHGKLVETLPPVAPLTRSSGYGELTYAAPPFDLAGTPLDYPFAPRPHGEDPLKWRGPH